MSTYLKNQIDETKNFAPATEASAVNTTSRQEERAVKEVKKASGTKTTQAANQSSESFIISAAKADSSRNMTGVGGELTMFRLSMVVRNPQTGKTTASQRNFVDFELAPARRSFADKQGQMVPGAGAGMEMPINMSLAELKVPGSRPVQQPMGIAGEYIELVGAFIGYDEYHGESFDGARTWDSKAANRVQGFDAWEKSQLFAQLVRAQREVMLTLDWSSPDYSHRILFENGTSFRGFIKAAKRIYASPQRVYYYIKIAVNNREDILSAPDSSAAGVFFLPKAVDGLPLLDVPTDLAVGQGVAGNTSTSDSTSEAFDPETAAAVTAGAIILNPTEAANIVDAVAGTGSNTTLADKDLVRAYAANVNGKRANTESELAAKSQTELTTELQNLRAQQGSIIAVREAGLNASSMSKSEAAAIAKAHDAIRYEIDSRVNALNRKLGVKPAEPVKAVDISPSPFRSEKPIP